MAWKESRAARRARVARQLRDRHGKWIEMGGGIKWFAKGKNQSGKAVAFVGDKVRVQMKDGSHELVSSRQVEPIKAKARIPNNSSTLTAKRTSSQGNQIVRIKDNDDSQRLSSNGSDLQVGDRVYHIGGANSRKKYSENQNQGQRLEADGYDIKLKSDGKLSYDTVAERVEGSHLTTTDGSRIEWDDLVLADDPEISDAIEKAMPGFDEDNSEDSASAEAETSQEKSTDPAEAIRAEIAKERKEFNARPEAERQLRTAGFTEKDIKDFNEAADIDDLKKFGDLDNSRDARKEAIRRESRTAPWATGEIERSEQDFTNGPLKEKAAELLGSPEAAKDYSDALNAGADHDAARDFAKASSSADVDKALSKSIKDTSDLETKDFLSDQERRDAERSHRLNNLAEKKKERLGSEDSAEAKAETPKRDDVDLTGLGLSKEESDYINEADNLEEALQRMDESDAAITNDVAKENGDKEFQRAYRNARNELMSKYSSDSDESASDTPEAPQTGKGTSTESVAKSLDNLGADLKEIDDKGLEDDAYENALDEAIYDFKGGDGRDYFMSGSQNEEGDWEVDLFDDGDNHLGSFSPSEYKNSTEFAEAIQKSAKDGKSEDAPESDAPEADAPEAASDSEDNSESLADLPPETEGPTATSPLDEDRKDFLGKIDSVRKESYSDEESKFVLDRYQLGLHSADRQINWSLRGDREGWLDDKLGRYDHTDVTVADGIATMDYIAANSTLPSEHKALVRGMKTGYEDFKVGDVLADKAFMSTSVEPAVGTRFMGRQGAMFKIDAPEGTHGITELMSGDENEFILPRGTRLEITAIEPLDYPKFRENFKTEANVEFDEGKATLIHARIVSDDMGLNGSHKDNEVQHSAPNNEHFRREWEKAFGEDNAPRTFDEIPSVVSTSEDRTEVTDIGQFTEEFMLINADKYWSQEIGTARLPKGHVVADPEGYEMKVLYKGTFEVTAPNDDTMKLSNYKDGVAVPAADNRGKVEDFKESTNNESESDNGRTEEAGSEPESERSGETGLDSESDNGSEAQTEVVESPESDATQQTTSPLAQDNAAIEAIQRKIDSKARDFSDEEHTDAVAKYTFRGDGQINWGLRQDRLDKMDRTFTESDYDVAEATARIDDAMAKSSLPGQVLARGMVIDDKEFAVGDILSDKGFVSTSADPSVAGNFMRAYDNSAMIKIDLDDNFHGLDVNSYLEKKGGAALMMAHEKEILLPRGTRLEITQIEDLTDESYKANFPDGEDLGFTANFGAKHKLFHARIVSDDKGLNGAHDDSNIGIMPEAYDPIQKAWFEEFGTYDAPEAFNELPSIKTDEHITQFTERVEITDIAEFAREYGQAREIQHMRDIMYADPRTAFVDEDGYTIRNRPGNKGFAVEDPNLGVTHYIDGVEKDADGFWKDRSPSSYYEEMAAIKRESNLDRPMDNSKYASEDTSESSADDQSTPDSTDEDTPTPVEAYNDSDPEVSDLENFESLFQQDPDKIEADIAAKESDDPLGERETLRKEMREITDQDYSQLADDEIMELSRQYDKAEYEIHLLNEKYDLPYEFENAPGDQDINEGGEDEFTENAPGDIVTNEEQSSIPEGDESGREESEPGDGTDGGDGGGDAGDGAESIDSGTDFGGVREETEDVGDGTGSELRGLDDSETAEIAEWVSGLSYDSPLADRTLDLPSGFRVVGKKLKDTRRLRYRVYEQDGEEVGSFIGHADVTPEVLAKRMQMTSDAYARVKGAMNSEDRTLTEISDGDLAVMGPGTVMVTGKKKFRKLSEFVWEFGDASDDQDRYMEPSLGRTPKALYTHDREAVQLYHDDESALTEFEISRLSDSQLDDEIARLKKEADKHAKISGELGDKQHLQYTDLRPHEKVELEYSTAKAAYLARRGRALAREKFSRMTADEILDNYSLDHMGDFSNAASTERTENALSQDQWDKVRNTYVTKDATTLKNNESLRSDSPSRGAKAWGTRVRKMVDSQRLREDATFHRGIAASPEVAAQFKPGVVFTDKGAMSVDRSKDSADNYLQARHNLRPDSIPVMMDLKVRKGQNIADVAYGEYVLAPDTRIFIESVEDDGNTRRITGFVNPTDDEINEWRREQSEGSSGDSEAEADASSDADTSEGTAEAETEATTDSGTPRRIDDADIADIESRAQALHDDIQGDDDPISRMGEAIELPDGSQLMYETINDQGDEGWLLLDSSGDTIGRYGISNKAPGRKAAKRAQTVWDRKNGGAPAAPRAEAQPSVPEMEGAPFKSGDRVTHGKHGKGTVSKIEGNGEYARISFDAYPSKLYGIKMSRLTPENGDSSGNTPEMQTPAVAPSNTPTPDAPSTTPGPADPPAPTEGSPFQVDDRVFHGKHGAGRVTRLEGNGEYARIEFDHTPGKHYGIKMSRLQSEQDGIDDPDTKIESSHNFGNPSPDPAPSKTKVPVDDEGEPFIEGKNNAKLYVGAVVIHPKFGRGRIVKLENNGQYVRVVFDNDPLGKPRGIVGGRLEDAAIVEERDFRK